MRSELTQLVIRFALYAVWAVVTPCTIVAQSNPYIVEYTNLSVEHGLSQRFVYCIYQDSRGFMWFGTQNGLNRYDGHQVKIFTKESHGLQHNHIWRIVEDNYQRLWVMYERAGNSRQIDLIDLETWSVQSFDSLFQHTGPPNETVFVIEPKTDGSILVQTNEGSTYELVGPRELELIFSNPSEEKTHVFSIPADPSSILFFETEAASKSLHRFDLETRAADTLAVDLQSIVNVGSLVEKWVLFAIGNEQLLLFDYPTNRFFEENDPHWLWETIRSFVEKEKGRLYEIDIAYDIEHELYWLSLHDQLRALNRNGEIVLDLSEVLRDWLALGIHNLYIDRNNLLWVGTNSGVIKISVTTDRFRVFAKDQDPILPIRGMASISTNFLLFSSETESHVLDLNTGAFRILSEKKPAYAMYWTADSVLNLSHYGVDYNRLSFQQDGTVRYEMQRDRQTSGFVSAYTFFQDHVGDLWIGSGKGLAHIDTSTYQVNMWEEYASCPELQSASVFHAASTSTGAWLATSEGLFHWNSSDGCVATYSKNQAPPFYLPANQIGFIHLDRSNEKYLWLGTRSSGLIRLNIATGDYQHWTRQTGLSDNTIYAIFEDDYEHLWLSSNYGIMQFDKADFSVTPFLVKDGIAHEEFNTSSFLQTDDGRIFFGGLNGITSFHPSDFYQDTVGVYQAPLVLTQYSRFNRQSDQIVDETDLANNGAILTVRPSDLFINFEFALLDFEGSEQHLYSYQIQGLSEGWEVLKQPSLRLYSLPAGTYQLLIQARNSAKGSSGSFLQYELRVLAPLYRRSWFIVLTILALGLLIWAWLQSRIRQEKEVQLRLEQEVAKRTEQIRKDKLTIEAQAERLAQVDQMKSRFFANISHELRTPLTLILTPVSALLDKPGANLDRQEKTVLELVRNNSLKLLRLIRSLLDLSKLDVDKMRVSEEVVHFLPFIRKTIAAFESKAQYEGVEFLLQSHSDEELILQIDTAKVETILHNLLSNAFKFTPSDGTITLAIEELDDSMLIQVQDTGIGIDEKDVAHVFDRYFQSSHSNHRGQGGTGIGLSLSSELAQLLGGTLTVASALGKGSTFRLEFPKKMAPPSTSANVQIAIPEKAADTSSTLIEASSDEAVTEASAHSVLLVEDNYELRLFIKGLLVEQGYQVIAATNGQEALDKMDRREPDLIVSDVMMPIMDGFTFLQHVKQTPKWTKIPFIMLTARAAFKDKMRALQTGVDDYLLKPFEPEELLIRIAKLIQNANERKAFIAAEAETETDTDQLSGNKADTEWLAQFERSIESHLNHPQLSIAFLAEQLSSSERQMYREVKRLTGLTPNHFIRSVRLQRAKSFLEQGAYRSVKEVCHAVGFQKPSYFSQIYRQEFGRLPSAYFD